MEGVHVKLLMRASCIYVNVDPDASPSLPLIKNPVYDLPPVGISDEDNQAENQSQLYVNDVEGVA